MRLARQTENVVDALEQRLLMCVEGYDAAGLVYEEYPAIEATIGSASQSASAASGGSDLSALPIIHSNAKATAKLFLDFDGAAATTWGGMRVPATPAFDQDGNAGSFSSGELAAIREIVARVAEKYSPSNLDVTTDDPGQYLDRKTQRMVIGGNGAWFGSAGGVSYVGAFYNSASNTSWIFPKMLGNGNAKYTAEATAHEAGHAFGLDHQSSYNAAGGKTDEYNPGNSQRAPIMGDSYDAQRGLWWKGTSSASAGTIQDDMSIIAGSSNGFGYRADDHSDSLNSPTPLATSGLALSGSGIISKTIDDDVFSFTTGSGSVTLNGTVISKGATLDLKLSLYTRSGTLVAAADTASLGETISSTLAAGTYLLVVSSAGGYGDVGQYTISGTVAEDMAINIETPTGLSAAAGGNQITLGWNDNASNEEGYVVERSTDGGATWLTLAMLGADSSAYVDKAVTAGKAYAYRVFATAGVIESDDSNVATALVPLPTPEEDPVSSQGPTVPDAPSNLRTRRINSNRVMLLWKDNSDNELGFRVEYTVDGRHWRGVGLVKADAQGAVLFGFTANRKYGFRVLAYNKAGRSDYSDRTLLAASRARKVKVSAKVPHKMLRVYEAPLRRAA